MATAIHAVLKVDPARIWRAVGWLLVSGWLARAANAGYGEIPIYFVENQGQFDAQARYVARGSGMVGYFGISSVVVAADQGHFRLSFPGGNPAPRLQGMARSAARINFLVGAPSQWRTDLPAWDAVAYRDIFPGVDLIYSSCRDHLKSDFMVAPGADPDAIRLRYEGGAIYLDAQGALILPVGRGEFREEAPVLYQEVAGERILVEGAFR